VEPVSTLGATSTRIETNVDSTPIILNVWDTAGQESLRNLVPIYARGSQAAVIVFDQSSRLSFDHAKDWYKYMMEHVGSIAFGLAANKLDLESEVDFDEVCAWANQHHIEVVRTSARQNFGVDTLFATISRELHSHDEKGLMAMAQSSVTVPPQEVKPDNRRRGLFRLRCK
jgi:small GTP-binding protein